MNHIENEYIRLEIVNEIVIGTYKTKIITLDIAKKVVKLRLEISNNKDYPVLIKDNYVEKIEKKARDYFSTKEGLKGIRCAAILTNSIFKIALANFFLKVSGPPIPVKLFSAEHDAYKWLNKFK